MRQCACMACASSRKRRSASAKWGRMRCQGRVLLSSVSIISSARVSWRCLLMTEQQKTETSGYHVLLAGVDTLVLNVRYADDKNRPVKQELADELVEQFDRWQKD